MGRSITDILNPETISQTELEDLSTQMLMDSTFFQPNMTLAPANTGTTAAAGSHAENVIAEPPFLSAAAPDAPLVSVRNVLFTVWLAVAFLIGTFKLLAYFSFKRRILKNSTPGNDRWDIFIPADSHLKIQIREAHLPAPVVFGIFRPAIIIPADSRDISAVRYSLIHEFLHIQHKDLLIKTLAEVSAVVQWFNPFAWLIRNMVNSSCEDACDEVVAERLSKGERENYTDAIPDFMDYSMASEPSLPPPLMSFSGNAGNVKKRINRTMKYRKPNKWIRIFSICIIILIAAAGTMTASSLFYYGNKMPAAEAVSSITDTSVPQYAGEPAPRPARIPRSKLTLMLSLPTVLIPAQRPTCIT
ncbi:MAG: M56 family metallopeptidase [Eubacteriales bacterium]